MSEALFKKKIDDLKFKIQVEQEKYTSALQMKKDVVRLMRLRMKIKKLKMEFEVLMETLDGMEGDKKTA